MGVEYHGDEGEHNGEDNDNLRSLESPLMVGGVVHHNVWQGVVVWHPLMGKVKAEGGDKESKYKEEETEDSLEQLIWEHKLLLQLLGQGDVNLHIRGRGEVEVSGSLSPKKIIIRRDTRDR